ncbi:MAG: hypothetical protein C0467_26170 [Planctomycetaceae bacterium]|nr:hypothetical protein [Planctomycetaceae bacterium]
MSPPPSQSGRTIRPPRPAQELVGDLKLSDDARKLLRPDMTVVDYFDALVKALHFPDAVRLVARAMTPKQAVWWGTLCIWATARPQPRTTEAAVHAVVKWLREPSDANRRAAGAAGTAVGSTTPAGLVATAAFLAEGSLATEGKPEVKPDPRLAATLVAEAVLALSRTAGHEPPGGPLVRQFLVVAVDVFRGTNIPEGKA